MNDAWVCAVWLCAAYFTGGIPFGFLIGLCRGVDVRKEGSKNIGATNVFRTVGKKWGLLAFALDVLKGLVPTLLARGFAPAGCRWLPLAVGIVCVVGHMLTPYMKFKGGKGVATAFGMLIALVPALVGAAFAFFAVLFALSHMISLGSCGAAAFLAVTIWFPVLGSPGTRNIPQCILVTVLALFVIWKHRANIGRIFRGEENRIYLFGTGKKSTTETEKGE
ncbi:MAG: glycerol-3-phosphate 1-O-acyltransferase PlsY [Kiritimatiellae bacterium]|nr:glycerol-3-phosphate 1-O-acyltransferase PlsY [Kiritimatiellia bacterium]